MPGTEAAAPSQDGDSGRLSKLAAQAQASGTPPWPEVPAPVWAYAAQLQHISALCPVQVTPWDPSRPWRGPTAQLGSSAQSSNPLFTQGPLWGPHHLSLGVWGWGQQPAHQLVVRQVSQRLRLIKAFGGKRPLATSGLTCPPRVLPRLG